MRKNAHAQILSDSVDPALERYLTVAEVAQHFQTGREQVHRWIRSGQLEVFRGGTMVRIHPRALEQFERSHTVPARARR